LTDDRTEITAGLKSASSLTPGSDEMSSLLDSLYPHVDAMKKILTDSTMVLPVYEIRQAQKVKYLVQYFVTDLYTVYRRCRESTITGESDTHAKEKVWIQVKESANRHSTTEERRATKRASCQDYFFTTGQSCDA
jgi:hypothetical protein